MMGTTGEAIPRWWSVPHPEGCGMGPRQHPAAGDSVGRVSNPTVRWRQVRRPALQGLGADSEWASVPHPEGCGMGPRQHPAAGDSVGRVSNPTVRWRQVRRPALQGPAPGGWPSGRAKPDGGKCPRFSGRGPRGVPWSLYPPFRAWKGGTGGD